MKYTLGFMLLLASWLQPLHVLPWVSWHSEVLAVAAVAWLFTLEQIDKKRTGQAFFAVPRVAMAPVALGIYALIQSGVGQIEFFGDALVICIYMALCSMVLMIGYAWGVRHWQPAQEPVTVPLIIQLALTVLIGAVISALIALVQAFNVWESADWILRMDGFRRPGANIGQPNHMATLLVMGIASLAFLFESRRLSLALAIFILILLILGVAVSESRTGLLSALALTAWGIYRRQIFSRPGATPLLVTGWLGLLLLVWAWPLFITFWHSGVGDARINTSAGLRLVVWSQLLEAVLQRPWFGWGLREVSEAHNAVMHRYGEGGPFTYAHNLVLDLAIGVGLPMTVLLLGWFIHWAMWRLKTVRSAPTWYCLALALPLAVHSMLEFPYSYLYFLVPVLLAVGMLEAQAASHAAWRLRINFAALGALSLLTVMVWSAVEYVAIEEDFQVARFEALRVGQTPGEYRRPEIRLLTQLDAMLVVTRTVPSPGMKPADIELLRRAAMRFPWTAIQNRYALALALNGSPEEAIRQIQVMRAMHGEKTHKALKENWESLAKDKYPQLASLNLP